MPKPRKTIALRASECARRTGITVRALRVYERYGLIAPRRSSQGWRVYGTAELDRLDAIATLKGLGLTLAQIRETLTGKSPSLLHLLGAQREIWRSRKAATDKVLRLIEAALAKLRDRERLSIDELCTLLRSIDMPDLAAIRREIASEVFTGDELTEWGAHYATLPRHEMAQGRELFRLSLPIAMEFRHLMARGAPPGSKGAQDVLRRHGALALQYGFCRTFLAHATWNPLVARKVYAYGNRLLDRASAADRASADGSLIDYMLEVRNASKWWRSLEKLLALAKGLKVREAHVDSSVAEELAQRFVRLCRVSGLGDASEFARWQGHFGMSKQGDRWAHYDADTRAGWEYLSDAVLTLRGEQPGPANVPLHDDIAKLTSTDGMRHYRSPDGTFALDIPAHWRPFPPVRANSPSEVIRFASYRDGSHLLIVFRGRHGPGRTLEELRAQVQRGLTSKGFGHFSSAETAIGRRTALTLDFDTLHWSAPTPEGSASWPDGDGIWSCREYFLTDGAMRYTLGFGTTNKAAMFEPFDRIARSFEILETDQAAA
jgi:DNA-binding transcriptional MerR regulator